MEVPLSKPKPEQPVWGYTDMVHISTYILTHVHASLTHTHPSTQANICMPKRTYAHNTCMPTFICALTYMLVDDHTCA